MGRQAFVRRPWAMEGGSRMCIGERTRVLEGAHFSAFEHYAGTSYEPRIEIGADVYIGRHCRLTALDSIVIESECVLSDYVFITDMMHGTDLEKGLIMSQPLESKGPVRIRRGTFLGYRVCVTPNVTLGEHCIVGAGSVVTRSFPAYSVIGGNPARLIRMRAADSRASGS